MRKAIILPFIIIISLLIAPNVWAGTFYLHDHPSYWWYMVSEPSFSAVVPASAQSYIERSVFGMNILEMIFENGEISMELGYLEGSSVEGVRKSLEERFKPAVSGVSVTDNREITTSNDIKTHFYAYQATGANGNRVMFRSVIFDRDDDVVYLALMLDADEYQADMREYWLRAVNEFEWN